MAPTQVNPIIPGYAPDPSLILVDGTYFLVNSTFQVFPGLPIYTSRDLIHWKHIGNAINRTSQLPLRNATTNCNPEVEKTGGVSLGTAGLFAPTIRYHNGTFYIACTNIRHNVDGAGTNETANFIISSTNILANEWSDPVYFSFRGIDPSLYFRPEGKAYLCGSTAPGPKNKIALFEVDVKTGEKLSDEKHIWAGTGGIYPEGPHIYFIHGMYYLMISEGGTHDGHALTMARSKDIWGPYEECPRNPILTARGTDEYVQFTGHCELFEGLDGDWWGVCLGVRFAEGGRFVMGRETFLTKGTWGEDGWLVFDTVKIDMEGFPNVNTQERLVADPGVDFVYLRDAELDMYTFSEGYKDVTLKASTADLSSSDDSPTFVAKRQRQLDGTATVTLKNAYQISKTPDIKAGLAMYKDEHRYLRIFLDTTKQAVVFEVINNAKHVSRSSQRSVTLEEGQTLGLSITYTEMEYSVLFGVGDGEMEKLDRVDTLGVTNRDFVGPVIGVFAVGERDGKGVEAEFGDLKVD